jgi:hypothetical protein
MANRLSISRVCHFHFPPRLPDSFVSERVGQRGCGGRIGGSMDGEASRRSWAARDYLIPRISSGRSKVTVRARLVTGMLTSQNQMILE